MEDIDCVDVATLGSWNVTDLESGGFEEVKPVTLVAELVKPVTLFAELVKPVRLVAELVDKVVRVDVELVTLLAVLVKLVTELVKQLVKLVSTLVELVVEPVVGGAVLSDSASVLGGSVGGSGVCVCERDVYIQIHPTKHKTECYIPH